MILREQGGVLRLRFNENASPPMTRFQEKSVGKSHAIEGSHFQEGPPCLAREGRISSKESRLGDRILQILSIRHRPRFFPSQTTLGKPFPREVCTLLLREDVRSLRHITRCGNADRQKSTRKAHTPKTPMGARLPCTSWMRSTCLE